MAQIYTENDAQKIYKQQMCTYRKHVQNQDLDTPTGLVVKKKLPVNGLG